MKYKGLVTFALFFFIAALPAAEKINVIYYYQIQILVEIPCPQGYSREISRICAYGEYPDYQFVYKLYHGKSLIGAKKAAIGYNMTQNLMGGFYIDKKLDVIKNLKVIFSNGNKVICEIPLPDYIPNKNLMVVPSERLSLTSNNCKSSFWFTKGLVQLQHNGSVH